MTKKEALRVCEIKEVIDLYLDNVDKKIVNPYNEKVHRMILFIRNHLPLAR